MTMSSGIESADGIAFTLTLDEALAYPVSAAPGEEWSYVSLPVNLLSVIIQNVTGESLRSFFTSRIAGPIGASLASWGTWAGYTTGAGQASLTARNLARVGYLTLREGQWKDASGLKSVISAASIRLLKTWDPFLQGADLYESSRHSSRRIATPTTTMVISSGPIGPDNLSA
jgi:CubicO group peptidase (beta-lactamase class C family)